jgi:protein-disulfide isomerase
VELRTSLTSGTVEVSESEVEKLYQENASAFAAMSPEEAKERLRLDLTSQERMRLYRNALAALKESMKIEVALAEPRLPLLNGAAGSAARGAQDAAITITEFSDFQCPYCREAQSALKQVLNDYKADVRLVFKHLPLDIHAQAFASAQAAFCAGEQDRFWQYHDALFAAEDLAPQVLGKLAVRLGLNVEKFDSCRASEASRAAVLNDVQEARRLGINSTPTFVINGKLVRGALSVAAFKQTIEGELKTLQHTTRALPSERESSPEKQ